MPADVIQSDYDALEAVASKFGHQSQVTAQMVQMVLRAYEPLHSGGWMGRGSQAFFNEMQLEVFPAARRLMEALEEANQVTQKIVGILQQAEQEASSPFKSGTGAGAGDALTGEPAGATAGPGLGGAWASAGFTPEADVGGIQQILGKNGFAGGGMMESIMQGVGSAFGASMGGDSAGTGGLIQQLSQSFDNILGGKSALGTNFFEGVAGGLANEFGIPSNWLSDVSDSLGRFLESNYNEQGLPKDWLQGTGELAGDPGGFGRGLGELDTSSRSDSGSGSRMPAGGGSGSGGAAPSGSGDGGGETGEGIGSGSGAVPSITTTQPAPGSTFGSPTGSYRPSPYSQGFGSSSGFTVDRSGSAAGTESSARQAPIRYQAVGGGGAAEKVTPSGYVRLAGGGAASATPAATGGQGSTGVPFGIAAASPFVALLGKMVKDRKDDR